MVALVAPPVWDDQRLEADRARAIRAFRDERGGEPLDNYLELFEECRDSFDELLETTIDLRQLSDKAFEVLTNAKLLEAFRYLPGPPISLDDLKVLAETPSLAPKTLKAHPELAHRVVATVLMGLDRRRFPWMSEDREASDAERSSAVLASAAMMASRRAETDRRHEGKEGQEQQVRARLLAHGFVEVRRREVRTLNDAPAPREFCMESKFGDRKADLIVGLLDHRSMLIECKVSNSATNSIKRLNNDAAAKAEVWRKDFGLTQVVPTAVLSGVYKLGNLRNAQARGLTIFWAHSLDEMLAWIDTAR